MGVCVEGASRLHCTEHRPARKRESAVASFRCPTSCESTRSLQFFPNKRAVLFLEVDKVELSVYIVFLRMRLQTDDRGLLFTRKLVHT